MKQDSFKNKVTGGGRQEGGSAVESTSCSSQRPSTYTVAQCNSRLSSASSRHQAHTKHTDKHPCT